MIDRYIISLSVIDRCLVIGFYTIIIIIILLMSLIVIIFDDCTCHCYRYAGKRYNEYLKRRDTFLALWYIANYKSYYIIITQHSNLCAVLIRSINYIVWMSSVQSRTYRLKKRACNYYILAYLAKFKCDCNWYDTISNFSWLA